MSDKDRMDVSTPPPGRRLTGSPAEFAPGTQVPADSSPAPFGVKPFRRGRWTQEEARAIANAITAELVVGSAMLAIEGQAAGDPEALKKSAARFSGALADLIRFGLPGMEP